jgi:aryl-alcohol dehydrogenase-like predicted oxidoreductase
MEYQPLGRTGVRVSKLCLGAMMFGDWETKITMAVSRSFAERSAPGSTSSTRPTSIRAASCISRAIAN